MGRPRLTGAACRDCGGKRTRQNCYTCKARADGLDSYCKACRDKRSQEFNRKNPNIVLDATARYRFVHYERYRELENERRKKRRIADVEWHEKEKSQHRERYRKYKAWYLAQNSRRRKAVKERTPIWADKKAIVEFYANCPPGYHVDHIVPLLGKTVSGLHMVENLQYLPALENARKGNRF